MTVETCPVCKGEGAVNDTPWVMDNWWWYGNAYPCSVCDRMDIRGCRSHE